MRGEPPAVASEISQSMTHPSPAVTAAPSAMVSVPAITAGPLSVMLLPSETSPVTVMHKPVTSLLLWLMTSSPPPVAEAKEALPATETLAIRAPPFTSSKPPDRISMSEATVFSYSVIVAF